jgi:hypothetical protein
MVRFFADGNLILEVPVPAITASTKDPSFQAVIPLNYSLASGAVLTASTENSESFNIIVEAFAYDWASTTAEYTVNSSGNSIAAVNTQYLIFTAAGGFAGCEISSILLKALETSDSGLVKLYLQDDNTGHTKFLFFEAFTPYVYQSGITPSFSLGIISQGSFAIQAGYHLYAACTTSKTFSAYVSGADWENV